MAQCFVSKAKWLLLTFLLVVCACASAPKPNWITATDYGVVSPLRKVGDARARARGVALQHARVKLFETLLTEKVEGELTVGQLVALDAVFRSKLELLIAQAKSVEEPKQARGILVMTVRLDKDRVLEVAKKRLEKDPALRAAAVARPITPAPSPAAAGSSDKTQ